MARTNGAATPDYLATLTKAPDAPPAQTRSRHKPPSILVAGLENYGAVCKVFNEIDNGFKVEYGQPIKDAMDTAFIAEGVALGRRPDNYDGHEGKVTKASLQLRDKTTQTTLKPEEVAEFQELGISLFPEVTVDNTLRVKPAVFVSNRNLVNEMVAFLGKNGYPVNEVFEIQDEKSRWIVGPQTVNDIFAKAKKAREEQAEENNKKTKKKGQEQASPLFDDEHIKRLLKICATPSITPTWGGTFPEAFEMFRKIAAPTEEERKAAAKTAAENPAAKPVIPTASDRLTAQLKASLAAEDGLGEMSVKPAVKPVDREAKYRSRFVGKKKRPGRSAHNQRQA